MVCPFNCDLASSDFTFKNITHALGYVLSISGASRNFSTSVFQYFFTEHISFLVAAMKKDTI